MSLERELTTFRRELPGLLADPANQGKFVLIHGEQVAGVWETRGKGLEAGYERFGLETFLVKEITEHEKIVYYSREVANAVDRR